MAFEIVMGIPEMKAYWDELINGYNCNTLKTDEKGQLKKLTKAFKFLVNNPRHPGLNSHEIKELSSKYGFSVFQSYLENDTPAAGRFYWTYGPNKNQITILAVSPHPEDKKKGAYQRIKLSELPEIKKLL